MKKAQVGMKVKAYTGRCVGILIQRKISPLSPRAI